MNNPTNERLAQAAQVKRVFDILDDIYGGHDFVEANCEECGACFDVALFAIGEVGTLRAEITSLLRSLGVEVVR